MLRESRRCRGHSANPARFRGVLDIPGASYIERIAARIFPSAASRRCESDISDRVDPSIRSPCTAREVSKRSTFRLQFSRGQQLLRDLACFIVFVRLDGVSGLPLISAIATALSVRLSRATRCSLRAAQRFDREGRQSLLIKPTEPAAAPVTGSPDL